MVRVDFFIYLPEEVSIKINIVTKCDTTIHLNLFYGKKEEEKKDFEKNTGIKMLTKPISFLLALYFSCTYDNIKN